VSKLIWDDPSKRPFEYGVDRGVFYPKRGIGHAWSGLVSVDETTKDASQSLIYIDGVGYRNHLLIGSFAASVSAMTYPDAFEAYDGYSGARSAQGRREFNFCYRTMTGSGHYKLHLVYNVLATPTDRNNSSINSTVESEAFSWDFTTRPVLISGARATSHFVIDTEQVNPGVVSAIEARLYGTSNSSPDMPTIDNLLAIFEEFAVFRVTDHGDGTVTVTGPDSAVAEISPHLWKLEWPSVIRVSEHEYQVSSL
jgi:hypothetical protein